MTTFAFVFPGQGSQSVGMLDAWNDHPVVQATLEEASEALGQDLGKLIHEGPKEALALTTNTQPVMLVAAIAAYRVWQAEGGAAPAFLAGHSLGEYSALVASGALRLSDAVPLVRLRAQAMQDAAKKGFATATDLADYLVKKGLPFRDAHETVAHAVKAAASQGCDLSELPLNVLQGFHASIDKDVYEVLSLQGSLNARNTVGGTAPAQVQTQISHHQHRLA